MQEVTHEQIYERLLAVETKVDAIDKNTSGTGDWMVSDSARGIVSGNDPYLELNNTNAEVTGEDWLDTDSTGFVVNEVSGSNANTNGATYIFLAIA